MDFLDPTLTITITTTTTTTTTTTSSSSSTTLTNVINGEHNFQSSTENRRNKLMLLLDVGSHWPYIIAPSLPMHFLDPPLYRYIDT